MKYVVSVLLALVITVLAATAPASADKSGKEPNCGHFGGGIASGAGSYDAPTVNYAITTEGKSCGKIEYTLHVLDADSTTELGFQTRRGNGTNEVRFSVPEIFSSSYEPVVCVYATSEHGHHLFDRFPETGCVAPPSCADIVGGEFVYDGSLAVFTMHTGAPSCQGVTYELDFQGSVQVTGPSPGFQLGGSAFSSGNGTTTLDFPLLVTPGSQLEISLCFVGTSFAGGPFGGHQFDRAPDDGAECLGAGPGSPLVVDFDGFPVHVQIQRFN